LKKGKDNALLLLKIGRAKAEELFAFSDLVGGVEGIERLIAMLK
jgi:hypothetical protein